ncbi:DUF1707 and DUF2154 domain-containing protein [Neiella marina]|uniref:DUF1707 and DUF2154 domain-containing protein n=1 Tax=Neiella holothuriorum TaxID=2870530 RepID=A0ABS7EBP8_9GAMM|nr:DUF1707 and DUF2154 domain-containing protein [Neiella holothuriorum]MBW8189754.1 DUF1707 and DUF2154 domain-containing protein [Neiella holothuriorum]
MPVKLEDRPIEKLRQETIDQLIMNYSHGEISLDAFERRLDVASNTDSHQSLAALTEDLELQVDQDFSEQKADLFHSNYKPGEAKDSEYMVNVFSGSDSAYSGDLPKEIRSIEIFSGSTIDLTEACFRQHRLTIRTICVFSGPTIYIPENVRVVSKVFSIFGALTNKSTLGHTSPQGSALDMPTIYVEGIILFSGLDIKLKRTIKERFIGFAENLKRNLGI